uniref:ATP synthase F0 subunit 8 n=1 Tax=Amynthas seungpanensis TaxID=2903325 RepID=UPI00202936D1|nr:ATP synthase F0 subunit 8 [Amynthas seungpanensis]UGW52605.1 ATP synthase F0 subunit 8 [Amynthas seungpanensis]
MPHLSPMSWFMALTTFWMVLLLLTTSTWWTNIHYFETDGPTYVVAGNLPWLWS